MKAICVDDEARTLKYNVDRCRELAQLDGVEGFTHAREAVEWLKDHPVDIAFLDIDMPEMDGIALAARIREMYPQATVVFLTAHKEFAYDAMAVRPSGDLLKPLTRDALVKEVEYASSRRSDSPNAGARVVVKTFGSFDVFIDGEMLVFPRSKSKEVLAYLVDRQGDGVRRADIHAVLWQGAKYGHPQQKYLDVIIRSLRETLNRAGISQILEMKGGLLRVLPENFDCDLYRLIQGDPLGVRAYKGRYMTDYGWARSGEGRVSIDATLALRDGMDR